MNRRTVLTRAGVVVTTATAGCVDDSNHIASETDQHDSCTPIPDDAPRLEYDTAVLRDRVPLLVDGPFDETQANAESDPFALVTSADDVATTLRLDALEAEIDAHAAARTFIVETDFETAALLVWQTSTPSGGYHVDIAGVVRGDNDSVHAYACRGHDGGGNGTVETPYTVLIRVAVPRRPDRAKLIYRRGRADDTVAYVDTRAADSDDESE